METLENESTIALADNKADLLEKQQRYFTRWLQRLVSDLAAEMGITLTKIQYVDGRRLGCRDAHLLKIGSNGTLVSTIIHEGELVMNDDSARSERTRQRIRGVLARLQQQADC
jgi:hypothetical protein